MSVNKVILVGNLGAEPELKRTTNEPVCRLSVATNETWKDKSGQRQERTEWHRVTVWGARAESSAKYLKKGSSVYIEGRLETKKWEDKDGSKRSTTEIIATSVVFLSGGGDGAAATNGSRGGHQSRAWSGPRHRESRQVPPSGRSPGDEPEEQEPPF